MYKIVRKSEAVLRKITDNKTALNYITKEYSPNVSLAVIEGINYDAPVSAEQSWIYYILEGEMKLGFKENQVSLNKGDVCYVSKGELFQMSGTYRAIIVCQPAFGTK